MSQHFSQLAAFIWSVADLLRGDFKQSQYGRIILLFTLLRRLECILAETKQDVLNELKRVEKLPEAAQESFLLKKAGLSFYNISPLDLSKLGERDIKDNLNQYIKSFSTDAREIFEYFHFDDFIDQLNDANLLYKVAHKFSAIDLSAQAVDNYQMGLVFEELIRRFAESSNETAGEHFTPRDIVRLTTSLALMEDNEVLSKTGTVRSIYDPTAGTGGFLSSSMEYVHELNPLASMVGFGQELNPESFAICKGDMLIKGQNVSNIRLGNTLSDDQLSGQKFDYMLSNPPFGVDWKKVEKAIRDEHLIKGEKGRFGPGLPRVSDGSLLFLMHLIAKMKDTEEHDGSRIGIILNGSPLFTGGAGSGESEIRRAILESDLLEGIIALPTDMFYNTGIATYVWILSNNKKEDRKGKVQLINGTDLFAKMRKSLGSKRNYLTEEHIKQLVTLFGDFTVNERSKSFDTTDFGYRRITVERPLRRSAQFTDEKIAPLQFLPTIPEISRWAWQEFGEAVYEDVKSYEEQITEYLNENKIKLKPAQKKELYSTTRWMEQKTLWEKAKLLKESLGEQQYDDLNEFEEKLKQALKENDLKLPAKEKKQLFDAITWKNPNAEKEIKKIHKSENILSDLYGRYSDGKGNYIEYMVDSELRDYENVPLKEDIEEYFEREVLPHVPEAWIDSTKRDEKDEKIGIVGYEIPFNRHFYQYTPPRSLESIDADLDQVSKEIMTLLAEVHS